MVTFFLLLRFTVYCRLRSSLQNLDPKLPDIFWFYQANCFGWEHWMIYRGESFLAVGWFGSSPTPSTPSPTYRQQVVYLSQAKSKQNYQKIHEKIIDTMDICQYPLYTGRGFKNRLKLWTQGQHHREGRVIRFFSSRRNWDSPNPSPPCECPPPFGSGGRGTLAG